MQSFSWRRIDKKNKFTAYFFGKKLHIYQKKRGDIAQLGERLNGIQEVSGSIPLISTDKGQYFFNYLEYILCLT